MTKDTTIAMVTPWDQKGGIANYSARLVEEIEAHGITVIPIAIQDSDTANPFAFSRLIERIPEDVDLIHVQFEAGLFGQFGMSGIGAPWFFHQLRKLSQPVVTTLHEVHETHSHHGKTGDYLLRARDNVIEACVIRTSDEIVVHTQEAERILRDRHGEKINIRRHLLPAERGNDPTPSVPAKNRFNLSGQVLLTFGWVEPKKKFVDVIRILPELPDVTYFVVGDPRPGDEEAFGDALTIAEELGVDDRVVRHEYVTEDDFDDVYGAADAAVLPYRRVSVSIAVNEAISYGLPTVTSALPYFEELRERYNCILTYETQGELKSSIENALFEDKTRKQLRESASHYVDEVNWTSFAAWTRELYFDIS